MARFALIGLLLAGLAACDDPGDNPITPGGGVGGGGTTTTGTPTGDGDGDGDGDSGPQTLSGTVCVVELPSQFVSKNCPARSLVQGTVETMQIRNRDDGDNISIPTYPSDAAQLPSFEYTATVGQLVDLRVEGDNLRRVVFEPRAIDGLFVPALEEATWIANVVTPTVGTESINEASIVVGTRQDSANLSGVSISIEDPNGEVFAARTDGSFESVDTRTDDSGTAVIMSIVPGDDSTRIVTATTSTETRMVEVPVFGGFTTVTIIEF